VSSRLQRTRLLLRLWYLDVILPLSDESGNPSRGRLAIRIAEQFVSAAANAVQQARVAEQNLSLPPVAKFSDAVTSITDAASTRKDLVTSIGSLMSKVETLVKVGDEIAKVRSQRYLHPCTALRQSQIHPYVNFAWQVLSAGLKVKLIG
jgi:hypothetical protein